MPAPERYTSPHEQLLRIARLAKARDLTFAEFWNRAVPPPKVDGNGELRLDRAGEPVAARRLPRVFDENPPDDVVLWPGDTDDRRAAYLGTLEARDGWQRAYDGEPAPSRETALAILAPAFEAIDTAAAALAEVELDGPPADGNGGDAGVRLAA